MGIRAETLVDDRTLIIFSEWRDAIDANAASYEALLAMRHRLRAGEFEAGPDRDLMILTVASAIAAAKGVASSELPDPPGLGSW